MIPFPDKKYKVIYADPPWKYWAWNEESENGSRNATDHYSTMSIEDLKALPIEQIADKNCALFIWFTNPLLPEGIDLIKAWDFEYKTVAFSWMKTHNNGALYCGIGHYTRHGNELCILAMKGALKRVDTSVYQVLKAPVTEHSKKPDEVRRRIVQLFGDVPRIELFARQKAYGWDAWGNELIDIPTLETHF